MNKNRSQWLRKAIKRLLLPKLKELGFEQRPLYDLERESRELVVSFPFGRHFRQVQNGVEIIEVQMWGGGWAEFRVTFGLFPAVGIYGDSAWDKGVHYSIDEAELSVLPIHMDLCRRGTKGGFFRIWYWPWQTPKPHDYERLVMDVVALLPQVDEALKTAV